MFTHKFLVGFCLVLSLAVTGPSYVAADDASYDLEVRMMIAAKSALDMLQGRDVQNVGVFKFRAMDDRHQITDDLGTANMRIAEQLTNSLMAVTLESGPAVHVALDANTVAANAPGAAHISPEGRKVLFEQDFQMSSGEHSKLDGLISGMFKLSRDLKSVSVAIMYADPTSEKLEPIVRFSAATDANFLAQCGERFQFVSRGPSDRLDGDQAAELALAAREDEQRPIVELDIFYNGKPVDVQEVDGELLIGEPTVRDSVHMVLRRLDRADEVLAVVLKVNGENVIYGDRKPDYTSQKIILHPDSPSCTIRGIWTDQAGHYRKFRVADETESRQLEIDYGPDVGLIQLVVFREAAEAV
ncbi:MAG: hypothetical protein KDB27_18275, partial [Planctomycetales bacterium]|nr:hypothetical protein [Planctomycetales bacterium]